MLRQMFFRPALHLGSFENTGRVHASRREEGLHGLAKTNTSNKIASGLSRAKKKKEDAETGPCLVNGGHDHAEQEIKKERQLRAVFCIRNSGCSWEPKETGEKTVPKVSLHMP